MELLLGYREQISAGDAAFQDMAAKFSDFSSAVRADILPPSSLHFTLWAPEQLF